MSEFKAVLLVEPTLTYKYSVQRHDVAILFPLRLKIDLMTPNIGVQLPLCESCVNQPSATRYSNQDQATIEVDQIN